MILSLRSTTEPSSTKQPHDKHKQEESIQLHIIRRNRCYNGPITDSQDVCRENRMSHALAIDELEDSGEMDSSMSDNLVAPLNAGIASGVREHDVELAVVNAEPSESDTSHIRIISEPCKKRFLGFFSRNSFACTIYHCCFRSGERVDKQPFTARLAHSRI